MFASVDQVAPAPADTTFEQAAALPLAATTALLCLDETGLEAGGRVLINGASGGVGTFAIQAAKATGLHVTAVVSTRNVALVESLGADEAIDYTATSFTRTGRTWDSVVDLVGNHRLRDIGPTVRAGSRLATMVAGGRLRPVMDRSFSLDDTAAAVRHVEAEHTRGKVVVTVDW